MFSNNLQVEKNTTSDIVGLSDKEQAELNYQLRKAIHENKYDLIENLVKQRANIDSRRNYDGFTPLIDVIVNKGLSKGVNNLDEKMIETLLKNGANPNTGLNSGDLIIWNVGLDKNASPLMLLLCRQKDFSQNTKNTADLLLKYKADINLSTKKNGMTALFYAVQLNCPAWVSYLINNGADISRKNGLDLCLLTRYAESRKSTAVATLLKQIALLFKEQQEVVRFGLFGACKSNLKLLSKNPIFEPKIVDKIFDFIKP